MENSNVTLITAMGPSNDKKENRALPWLVGEPNPTAEVIEEIVNRFHVYAMLGQRKLNSKNEEEKRIARTFLKCCEWGGIVRVYFKDKAGQIDTKEARNIAQKARNVVDEFYDWFQPRGLFTKEDWKPYMKLLRRWERVVARFDMCMNSGNQEEKPAETKQDIAPAKYRGAWNRFKGLVRELYGLTIERITKAWLDKYG